MPEAWVVHRSVTKILGYSVFRIGDVDFFDFRATVKLCSEGWIYAGKIGWQIQFLIAHYDFIAHLGIEVDSIFID